jgi:hypothetical protein
MMSPVNTGLGGQQAIQAIRFSAHNAVEIVDPDG